MTGIFVNDPDDAFKFYTEVLGFTKRVYIPEARLAVVVSGETDGMTSLLLGPKDNEIGKNFQEALYKQGIPAIVMGSKDIQAEYENLVSKGVVFRSAPTKTQSGTQALFDDTCGNLILLHQVG